MTPYEKRFHLLQQEYRIITKQVKDSANDADITLLNEQRTAIIVETREIINKAGMPAPKEHGTL
jgi:predicted DNA-binding protein (UPF0278 family)